jgi:potassium-transporting ATPase KdpC subunit
MKTLLEALLPSVRMLLAMTVLTGVLYPALMTGVAQALFREQANGSVVHRDRRAVGSALVGQEWTSPRYFWGRPSATSPTAYNGASSGGSNLGPTNPALHAAVRERAERLRASHGAETPIPVDLVTASGSGLDPDISIAAALYQAERVAHARHSRVEDVQNVIRRLARPALPAGLGEPRVNVLELNLALDRLGP